LAAAPVVHRCNIGIEWDVTGIKAAESRWPVHQTIPTCSFDDRPKRLSPIVHALSQDGFGGAAVNRHGRHEIMLAFNGVDRLKGIRGPQTDPAQIVLKLIGVGYAMTQQYLRVEFLAQVGLAVNTLADERQPAVGAAIGIGWFNREALQGSLTGEIIEYGHVIT
jgi:hypothetical protein